VDVAGATGSSYVLVAADVGSTVRVVVTASNAAGAGAPATSVASEVVLADRALLKTATASSSDNNGRTAPKAVDGKSNTRWSSQYSDNQWWQVDLGSVVSVATVALNWEAAYASSYKLQVSMDGVTWTDLATVTNTAPGWKLTTVTPVSTRYIRMQGLTRATQYGYSFWDAQVFGPAA
jgi:hypothetical protein